jgi:hypothetical protein
MTEDGQIAERWTEFEGHLDALLVIFDPAWVQPPIPPGDPLQRQYERLCVKRLHVGGVLQRDPGRTAAHAAAILDAIVRDDDPSFTKQLVGPLIAAIGRRAVQRHLIQVAETGSAPQQVCATFAWYWSQVTLVYRSPGDLDEKRATERSRAADDLVADLRAGYRIACLTAFVASRDDYVRERLADWFLLVEHYYPPTMGDLVAQARAIAEADPRRYARLLARSDDGSILGRLGGAG